MIAPGSVCFRRIKPHRPAATRYRQFLRRFCQRFALAVTWAVAFAFVGFAHADVDFEADVVPALTRARCNSGPCHGSPSGKNGFRLSLLGYFPEQDYQTLARENLGRRVLPGDPVRSLLLQKATAAIPHEGGKRFEPGDPSHAAIANWIAAGCPKSTDSRRLTKLSVSPDRVRLEQKNSTPLTVTAWFSDGSARIVTERVMFSSSDDRIATVSTTGTVAMNQTGDAAILCRYRHQVAIARFSLASKPPGFVWSNPPISNDVDHWTFQRLRERWINPAPLANESTFLRRLWLDVAGRLPPVEETIRFLNDPSPDKRDREIDLVLNRPEYADFWAMKWSDILRSSRKKAGDRGVTLLHRFLVQAVRENVPLDQMARRLILARGDADSVPESNFYRIAGDAADCGEATAQLWLGIRIQCAKCHNHPFDRWTQDDYLGLAAFFSQVQRKPTKLDGETIFLSSDPKPLLHPRTGKPATAKLLVEDSVADSTAASSSGNDPRIRLADWMVAPTNRFFARAAVNRVWFHLFGRGIVDPPDDFRDSNPPSNDDLLEGLADRFVQTGYDVKALIRFVVQSRTYQLSAAAGLTNATDERMFSRAYSRLLGAEVLLDAVGDVCEIPERFADRPVGTRAVQMPDGDAEHPFLKTFGQPTRESSCECGRGSDPTLAQVLNLMNGPLVHGKLTKTNNRIGRLLREKCSPMEVAEQIYLAAYSRRPIAEEKARIRDYLGKSSDARKALEDICWSVLNSKEFVLRP